MEHFDSEWALGSIKDSPSTFEGWASVFNVTDHQDDCITFGAFQITILQWKNSTKKLPMLWQHDTTKVIGEWQHIIETPKGLYVKGRLTPHQSDTNEIYNLLKEQKINGLSIGYTIRKAKNKGNTRYIQAINLHEISLVTLPANSQAIVETVNNNIHATI